MNEGFIEDMINEGIEVLVFAPVKFLTLASKLITGITEKSLS